MGILVEVITPLHTKTSREYANRMIDEKVKCMEIARKYGQEFWDGDRRFGYGGYKYDGRHEPIAKKLIEIYNLKEDAKILDIGCGKGFLLYEFKKLLPNCKIMGFDISEYAIENCKPEISSDVFVFDAKKSLPFEDNEFDLVISINTLHNLELTDLKNALKETERVGKNKYICVEAFRNPEELFNLQCWALTCDSFFTPRAWKEVFDYAGYTGDYEFIYFE